MKVSIRSQELKLTLPVPLFMGSVIIRCTPKEKLNNQQKKMALQLFKTVKYSLKGYKGLKLVEVLTKKGDHITITI